MKNSNLRVPPPPRQYGTLPSSQEGRGGEEVSAFQKKLNETARLAKKNDHIAGDVLEEMQSQRVTLDQAHEDLTVMETISSSAQNTIHTIQSKSNRKEMTLKAIMIILFVVDFLLILIVFKNGGSLFA